MTASGAKTVVDTADRLFAAIERGDVTAVAAMWSDDIAVWRGGAPPRRGKAHPGRGVGVLFLGAPPPRPPRTRRTPPRCTAAPPCPEACKTGCGARPPSTSCRSRIG
ncbi:hypothetical protein [Mycobacterium avium]|uniref:hypothetical protein n=1 Tax=Mycobacterium avium TaxID=1764 RepID=UPI00358DB136